MSERPVVFSASSVNAYLDCRLRWYFQYVLMEAGVQSEAQRVGIAVHDAAESILRAGRHGERLTWSSLIVDGVEIAPIVEVFNRDIVPTYRDPVLIEASFQISVNGIPFSGIIDSVDRQDIPIQGWSWDGDTAIDESVTDYANILRDLKTTGSRPKAGRYHFNMVGYWLGARELGYTPDIMQLDYIVRTKTPYYWPEVVAAPDENDIEWFATTLQGAAEGVQRADYSPTGLGTRACSYCPVQTICGPYQRYKEVTDA